MIPRTLVLLIFLFLHPELFCQSWTNSNILEGTGTVSTIEASLDFNGDIIVFGYFDDNITFNNIIYSTSGGRDYFLAKYDSDLNPLWFRSIGSANNEFVLGGLCTCTENNIFIAGGFQGNILFSESDSIIVTEGFDTFVASFTSEGSFLWAKNVGSGQSNQRPTSILFDNDENLLISGFFDNIINFEGASLISNGSNDAYLLKLDRNGNFISSNEIDALNSNVRVFDMVTGLDGYYFTGTLDDSIIFDIDTLVSFNSSLDAYLYKTDFDLNGLWVNQFTGPGLEYSYSIDVDEGGYVYWGGYSNSIDIQIDSLGFQVEKELGGGYDAIVSKYSPLGQLLWFNNYGGISDDQLFDIEHYEDIVYFTGTFSNSLNWGEIEVSTNGTLDNGMILGGVSSETGQPDFILTVNGQANYQERGKSVLVNENGLYSVLVFGSDSIKLEDKQYSNSNPGNLNTVIGKIGCKPINLISQSATLAKCYKDSTGTITIDANGGFSELLYSIDNGQTFQSSPAFTKVPAGEYQVLVMDSAGCEQLGALLEVDQPDSLYIFSIDSVDVTTNGGDDGSIFVTGSGGTTPYNWTLNQGPPIQTGDFTGLTAGKYQAALVDANDCGPVLSDSITIREPGVGLADFYAGKITLYPNPVHSSLTLSLNDSEPGEILILISDASGKSVLSKNFTSAGGEFTRNIEVSDLDRGLYFVRIAGGETLGSFVKE